MVRSGKLRHVLLAAAFTAGGLVSAQAAELFSPPPAQPVAPSANEDWYLTLGASGQAEPSYPGADNYSFRPGLIFSIRKASQLNVFRSVDDNPSIALFDTGTFRIGAVGRLDWGRSEDDAFRLTGLGDVGVAVEAGGFAEWYITDWFRTRAELRYGVGGFEGIRGLIGADVIVPYGQWRFAVGPRLTYGGSGYMETYFGITPQQAFVANAWGNPLPVYNAGAGFDLVGATAQLTYNFRNGFEAGVYGTYGRLLGDAASSPLTSDANQFMAGVSLSYTFNIGKAWW
ncbi:MipA/OmpV family protein [Xanthobacter dioxanivorans]|uniref:MipA/OmpV family protein n=1 Tax=Xanthobacter dioxanivorans TaxID=2528964 RepID=A0A974PMH1_9HYPH|nr:MipA/OmpV family protein [Xanthobacter dioxanivorans]QRG06006.1 MipA/OmpV family protein [Xanthobacter dioxanivorans]